jgi:hypothetical protein
MLHSVREWLCFVLPGYDHNIKSALWLDCITVLAGSTGIYLKYSDILIALPDCPRSSARNGSADGIVLRRTLAQADKCAYQDGLSPCRFTRQCDGRSRGEKIVSSNEELLELVLKFL